MAQHPRTDWEKVTSDLRKSKTSKADQSDAPPTNLSLDLDSIMPESGQAEDVANVPTLKLAEPDVLPDAALTPEGQSLRDFQSTLTNTPEERANVSNLMQFGSEYPVTTAAISRGSITALTRRKWGSSTIRLKTAASITPLR